MGSSSSKLVRKLPTKPKPSWAGTTRSDFTHPHQNSGRPVLASETKSKDIELDAGDPQFLKKLNQLGPVKVDHHMTTIKTDENMKHILQARQTSELQANTHISPRNHILVSELVELLEMRKSAKSPEEMRRMSNKYNIDVAVLDRLSKSINTPSVVPGSRRKVVGENGEERDTMLAGWVDRDNLHKL